MKPKRRQLGFALMLALCVAGPGALLGAPGTGGIYVDDSPAATETFDRARGLVNQKRYVEAVGLFLKLNREHEGRLIGTGPGRYADIQMQVRQALQSDERLLAAYRSEAEPEAGKALAKVREEGMSIQRLQSLADRYWLTKSGLTATLDACVMMIANGDFGQAQWLVTQAQSHPDVRGQGERLLKIQITLARLTGDKPGLAKLMEEAKGSQDPDLAQTGAAWTKVPAAESASTASDEAGGQTTTLNDLRKIDLKVPLWEFSLRSTYLDDTQIAALAMQGYSVREAKLPFIVKPVVSDGMVIINTGLKVVALDRLSGRQVWSHTGIPINLNNGSQTQTALVSANRRLPEARAVAIQGDNVLAVMGYSPYLLEPWSMGSQASALVCLDRATGRQLWRYSVPQGDPRLGRTMLTGTPVISGNLAYAMYCRPNAGRNEQMGAGQSELFLGAFNIETGVPVWTRYILASGRVSSSARPETAQVIVDGGDLVVLDGSGALTRVDARSGQIRWLATPMTEVSRAVESGQGIGNTEVVDQPPVEFEPMRLPVGLVLKVPGSDQVSVFDAQTGQPVATGNTIRSGGADSIAQVGENFILASRKLQLIDGATFKRRWETGLPSSENEPFGMPWPGQVIRDVMLLPIGPKLFCYDLDTGKLVDTLAMAGQGTLRFSGREAILTDRETIRFFMPWDAAIAYINEQARKHPDDPRTGMSLASLGFKKQDAAVTGQGLELIGRIGEALKAAKAQSPDASVPEAKAQAMVEFLAAFAGAQGNLTLPQRKGVLDTLGRIVQTPQQEVEYRLLLIDYLRQAERPQEAVAQVQHVLGDATLASQPVTRGMMSQRAEFWARSVLAALIDEHGPGVYAAFEAQAKSLLDAQVLSGSPDPDACQRIAERFPFAQVTPRALYMAGVGKMARDPSTSTRLLARAYLLGKRTEDMELILSKLVDVNLRLNQQTRAIGWLRRAQREYPGMMLYRQEVKISPEAWIAHLQERQDPGETSKAGLREMLQPVQFQGMLLPEPIESLDRESISGRYITAVERSMLSVIHPTTLARNQPQTIQGMAGPVALVFQDSDRLCVWMPAVRRLVFFGVGDLLSLMPGPDLDINLVLESAGNDQSRLELMTPEQRVLEPMLNPRRRMAPMNGRMVMRDEAVRNTPRSEFIGVNDSVIVVADNNGRVCAVDRSTGEVAWKALLPMEQLESLSMSSDAVVLKGVLGRFKTDEQSGVVVVLDPLTGEQRMPVVETQGTIPWAGVTGDGYLAYMSNGQVVSRPVKAGAQVKRMAISRLGTRAFFAATASSVLIQEGPATLAMFDPAAAQITGRVSIRPSDEREPVQAVPMGKGWLAWMKGGMVALDRTGNVLWKAHEDYGNKPWAGVRVMPNQVLAIRPVDSVEPQQGAAMPVFGLVPGGAEGGAGQALYVKIGFVEGKVAPNGQQEIEFKARVTLNGGRMVWLTGTAQGHVSATTEDKEAKVKEAFMAGAAGNAELGPVLNPAGGKQATTIFSIEPVRGDRPMAYGGLMYELLSYESSTGRLVGNRVLGPLKEPVDPETWLMSNDRLFMDKQRTIGEDGVMNRFNRQQLMNLEEDF